MTYEFYNFLFQYFLSAQSEQSYKKACIYAEEMPLERLEHISPLCHKITTHLILALEDEVNFDIEMYLGISHP